MPAITTTTLPNGLTVKVHTCDPALHVYGATANAFVENFAAETYRKLAEQHGLTNFPADSWVPLQPIFDLFNQVIAIEHGSTQSFVAMGMRIAQQSAFPPELQNALTLTGILEGWQQHYNANHQGAPLPPVTTVKLADHHYQLHLLPNHLYPFDLVYGMVYGFCRLLLPSSIEFTVRYVDGHTPYGDYSSGVIIDVQWV